MFDPLNSNNSTWGGTDEVVAPSWPTVPHSPNAPIPNLRRASTPVPPLTPDKGPTPGIYGKEPQIYGQPESGLISPRDTVGSNGSTYEKPEPYLRVKITGLDRNRRDILIKLDAQVLYILTLILVFARLFTITPYYCRPTCPISPAPHTEMYPAHTSNSNPSTSLSCKATRKPSYPPFRWHKHQLRLTRKTTVWSE